MADINTKPLHSGCNKVVLIFCQQLSLIVYLDDSNQSCLHHQDALSENGDVMGEFSYL